MSTHLVSISEDYSTSPLRFSPFRRRLRTSLTVLVILVLGFVGLIRVYVDVKQVNVDRILSSGAIERSYPPLTRAQFEQQEAIPPPQRLRPPPPQQLHVDRQDDTDKIIQPALRLTISEELGAVMAYLTSLGANAMIPPSIDPSAPVDPELILEFNTRSPRAREEIKALMADTWAANPVVVISESRQPASRTVKTILDDLNLYPMPIEMDVDLRSDGERLRKLMYRLTSSKSLPIVLVGGRVVGTLEEFEKQHKNGQLEKRISAAGATVARRAKKQR